MVDEDNKFYRALQSDSPKGALVHMLGQLDVILNEQDRELSKDEQSDLAEALDQVAEHMTY